MIHDLNSLLNDFEKKKIIEFDKISEPIIFIVAPPRSGTTLVYQLLTYSLDCFYPNNLIAKFYSAPYLAINSLSDLELFEKKEEPDYKSDLGNTSGIYNPHEWGWFWDKHLINNSKYLRNEIAGIQSIISKPMIFKNINFNYFIPEIINLFGDSAYFLIIKRNNLQNAVSIKNAINKRNGPIGSKIHYNNFIKISNIDQLAVLEVLYDVLLIESSLKNYKFKYSMEYEDMCKNPTSTIERFITSFYKQTNYELIQSNYTISESFNVSNHNKSEEHKYDKLIGLLSEYKDLKLEDISKLLFYES